MIPKAEQPKYEPEDDYIGPATGWWVWFVAGAVIWIIVIAMCVGVYHGGENR